MNDEGEEDLEVQAKMEELFNKLGISVYKANGELKNTYEIMGTLAPVYKELTNAEKAYVTETIAGKYQAQNAAALLQNWTTAVEANETAINSQGSALRENAVYLDSIEGKINAFKSSFEELSTTIVSSDLIKSVVDFGTLLLNVANSAFGKWITQTALISGVFLGLLKVLKSTGTALTLLTDGFKLNASSILMNNSALIALNSQTKKNIAQEVLQKKNIDKNTLSLKAETKEEIAKMLALEGIEGIQAELIISELELSGTNVLLKGTSDSLTSSIWAMTTALLSNPLFWGAAIIGGISALITYLGEVEQKNKELAQSANQSAESLKDEISSLEEEKKSVVELRKELENGNLNQEEAYNARQKLIDIQDKLIEKYGDEAKGIDLVNGQLDEQIKKIGTLEKTKAQQWLNQNQKAIDTANKKVNSTYDSGLFAYEGELSTFAWGGSWKKGRAVEDISKDLGLGFTHTEGIGASTIYNNQTPEKVLEELNKLSEYIQKNRDKIKEQYKLTSDEIQDILNKTGSDINTLENTYDDYFKLRENEGSNKIMADDTLREYYQKELEYQEEYKDALSKGNAELSNKILGDIKTLKNEAINTTNDASVKDAFKRIFSQWDDDIKSYDLKKSIQESIGKGNLQDSLDFFSSNKISKSGILDIPNNKDATKEQKEAYQAIVDGAKQAGVEVDEYVNKLVNMNLVYADAKEKVTSLEIVQNTFLGTMTNLQNAYDACNSAIEEYNTNGSLSAETLQNLMNKGYTKYLEFTENGIRLNTKALYADAEAAKQAMRDNMIFAAAQRIVKIASDEMEESVNDVEKGLGTLDTKIDATAKAMQPLITTLIEGSASADMLYASLEGKGYKLNDDKKKKIQEEVSNITNAIKQLDKVSLQTPKSKGKGSSSSSKSTKEWWEEELDKLKDQYNYNEINIQQYIDGLDKLLDKTKKGSDAWKKINEELQKQRLSKIEDDYKDGRISLDKYIASLKELIKQYKEGTKAWDELAEKIKKGLQDQAKETKSNYDSAKSAIDKVIDDEIKKLEEQKDALKDKNDEEERAIELARLQETLENAKKNKTKRVWNGSEWVWMADQNAINDAQKALDDFNKKVQEEDANKEIQDKIDALNKLKEDYADVTKVYDQEQQKQQLTAMLGANAEADILNQRIETLNKFKDKYLDIQKQIANYDKASTDSLVKDSTPTTTSNKNTTPTTTNSNKNKTTSSKSTNKKTTTKSSSKKKSTSTTSSSKSDTKTSTVQPGSACVKPSDNKGQLTGSVLQNLLKGRSYASGGLVDYTGLAMLHGTPSRPEVVLNYDQMKGLMSTISRPEVKSNVNNTGQNVMYNFYGDFNLPNVNNSQQFLRELKSQVNIRKHN